MRVLHLSYADTEGGAARAAYRIHRAVLAAGVDSRMWVVRSGSGDETVMAPFGGLARLAYSARGHVASRLDGLLRSERMTLRSPALIPSGWPATINASDADLVHLHWVGGEMISVEDIGKIEKPIVWTMHDMWPFCGTEHYATDERWRSGYAPASTGNTMDVERWAFERKRRHWLRPMHMVAPSRWMAECARQSPLTRRWAVEWVPNPLDMDRWKPVSRRAAREVVGLGSEQRAVLFGAFGGGRDPRKGFDLLEAALQELHEWRAESGEMTEQLKLLVFGEPERSGARGLGFPVEYVGRLNDDLSMRALYSAADVFVLPSRQDNLPNTGVEALACGTPVVAFDVGGMSDIVEHERTGYLAEPFDPRSLARGILWVLGQVGTHGVGQLPDLEVTGSAASLRERARAYAVETFSSVRIGEQYAKVYRRVGSLV